MIKSFVATSDPHGFLPKNTLDKEFDFLFTPGDLAPDFNYGTYTDYFEFMFDVEKVSIAQKEWIKNHFMPWTKTFKAKNLVSINGNHDFGDYSEYMDNYAFMSPKTKIIDGVKVGFLPGMVYAGFGWNDEIPEDEFERRINLIDKDIDVLISHTPPYAVLDLAIDHRRFGCQSLYKAIFGLRGMQPYFTNLKLHIFGHIHNDRMIKEEHEIDGRKVLFVNAAKKIVTVDVEI